nr:ABC transporter ATP-binding protein [Paenibacillus curdlanolyticus]
MVRKINLSLYSNLFTIAVKNQKLNTLIFILLSLVEAVIPIIQVYIIQSLIDGIVETLYGDVSISQTLITASVQLVIHMTSYIIASYKSLVKTKLIQTATYTFDHSIINKLMELPLIFFEKTDNYNLIDRVSNGMGNKAITVLIMIIDIVKYSITLVGYSFLLFKLHWSLVFILIVLLVPSLFSSLSISKAQYSQAFWQTHNLRRSNYLLGLFSNRIVQKEIKIFGHGKYLIELWKSFLWQTSNEQYQLEKTAIKKRGSITLLNQVINFIYVLVILWFVAQKYISAGEFVAYSSLLAVCISNLELIARNFETIGNYSLVMQEYVDFNRLETEQPAATTMDEKPVYAEGIQFNNVSFRYPNGTFDVLKKNFVLHQARGDCGCCRR